MRVTRVVLLGILTLGAALSTVVAAERSESQSAPPRDGPHRVSFTPSVMVAMDDGVRLSTDLYRPDAAGRFPVILIRTPYDKNGFRWREDATNERQRRQRLAARYFASHGFVVAVQDMRGKWESEGRFSVFEHERRDFAATVDWLATQPWATGDVGTYGCSYSGETQIVQAATRHRRLKAIVPQSAAGGMGSAGNRYRYFAARNGGAVELGMGLGWFSEHGTSIMLKPPAWALGETWTSVSHLFSLAPRVPAGFDYKRDIATLPVRGMLDRSGFPPTDWNAMVSEPPGSRYWNERDYLRDGEKIDVPGLHVNSWYDYGVGDTIQQFLYFQAHGASQLARDNQYLVIGAGLHCSNEWVRSPEVVGERHLGDPRFDHWSTYLAWFNRWLKGDVAALEGVPRVQYYLQGKNEWRSAARMPIPGTQNVAFHLRSQHGANGLGGDGTLDTRPPTAAGRDRFVYDPGNPVPSLGGPVCCIDSATQPEGAFDQRRIEARPDVLVYSTPPLEMPLTVVGPVRLVLFVSSSARDTDFTAKLVDVYPDGRAFNLNEGILRARYREGQNREVFMAPGGVYRLDIDLQAIGNWFGAGHRIRLEVSSSNFPRFDRNLNTGGRNFDETAWTVANNVVHFGPTTPSHVLLPVVRNE